MNAAANTMDSPADTPIYQLMSEREAAMRARDAERLVSRYTSDVVKFDLAPPLQSSGGAAVDAAGLRNWFAGFEGAIEFEIRDLRVTVGGDVAYCYSLNRLSARPAGLPQSFTLWFRATMCLRRLRGVWLIAHEHNSTPFYMDGSLRAALDLEP